MFSSLTLSRLVRQLGVICFLSLSACRTQAPAAAPTLLSDAQAALAERDRKLDSYRFLGSILEDGLELRFDFAFRSPNRMRLELVAPEQKTLAYDGVAVYERVDAAKTFTRFEMDIAAEAGAPVLSRLFGPFAPEGFRAPLLPRTGVTAEKTSHPRSRDAVALRVTTSDDAGAPLTVTYTFRWPSMDFLEKRMQGAGGSAEVSVVDEFCDAVLKLCVPKHLQHRTGEQAGAVVTLREIQLNAALVSEMFTLRAPNGFAQKTHALSKLATPKR